MLSCIHGGELVQQRVLAAAKVAPITAEEAEIPTFKGQKWRKNLPIQPGQSPFSAEIKLLQLRSVGMMKVNFIFS